jgi:hypothetical protein
MGFGDERADGGYRESLTQAALESSEAGYRVLKARIQRVRDLHSVRHYNAGSVCLNCGHTAPCATLRALDDESTGSES